MEGIVQWNRNSVLGAASIEPIIEVYAFLFLSHWGRMHLWTPVWLWRHPEAHSYLCQQTAWNCAGRKLPCRRRIPALLLTDPTDHLVCRICLGAMLSPRCLCAWTLVCYHQTSLLSWTWPAPFRQPWSWPCCPGRGSAALAWPGSVLPGPRYNQVWNGNAVLRHSAGIYYRQIKKAPGNTNTILICKQNRFSY